MERSVSKEAVRTTMGKIWKLSNFAEFKKAGKNVFIITFSTEVDKHRVLVGKPWLFDNFLFALQLLDGKMQFSKTKFEIEQFWIQLHDLLVRYVNRNYGEMIGNSIEKVTDVDVDTDDTRWGSILRVKVEVNLLKPLARGRKMSIKNEDFWIPLKYAKLPKFYFGCG